MKADRPAVGDRDAWARRFVGAIPGLQHFTGGPNGFDRLLQLRRDTRVSWRGRRIHLELYSAGPEHPTVIFHHGYGAYSALYAPFLAPLSSAGINVVALDRPGHGLSDGRRGDCTVAELAEVTRLVIVTHVAATARPLLIFGSSAGGMLTSCLIPYLHDVVDGYLCHGVHDPAYARPVLGAVLARVANAIPAAKLPYRLLPSQVRTGSSDIEVVRAWFLPGSDSLATFDQTLRSVFSMTVAYRPPIPVADTDRPLLVITGNSDRIVPASRSERAARHLGLRSAEVITIDGGHMLLHENPGEVHAALLTWMSHLPGSRR